MTGMKTDYCYIVNIRKCPLQRLDPKGFEHMISCADLPLILIKREGYSNMLIPLSRLNGAFKKPGFKQRT